MQERRKYYVLDNLKSYMNLFKIDYTFITLMHNSICGLKTFYKFLLIIPNLWFIILYFTSVYTLKILNSNLIIPYGNSLIGTILIRLTFKRKEI